ncbi:MAG: phospholipase D-like domain-containing protein [Kiritimatiellae bacterium]|nr:phospholipase D-like domain-containing protein [Kiritimatiellia bacterium]
MAGKTGTELFLVDNSDADWKVLRYLHDWCQLAKGIDIATGYFEIGSLLALKDEWKKVDHIRLLMGDEVSKRTKVAFEKGLQNIRDRLDTSIESEKQHNDFLTGVPAIVAAIRSGRIQCRVYRKEKFHAKAYITHAKVDVVGSSALVGSSNFTIPGLTENIELNVQITGQPVSVIQAWYEKHWQEAEDVTPDILKVFERHIREHTPFEVYARALQEFFRGHEMTADEWELAQPEQGGSHMYPVLDLYQKQGCHNLLKIAGNHGGAFLCDGVGLGKTFVGLMLIERLIMYERKRVALFVPKAARADVWETAIRKYLPHVGGLGAGVFSNLVIFNHTDLGRTGSFPQDFQRMKEMADVIIIDEAHHFRNPGIKGEGERRPSRYRLLFDLMLGPQGPKQLYLLTATPINNRLDDFRHMTELFSRQQDNYFAGLGIHSLRGHFVKMERELKKSLFPDMADQPELPIELPDAEKALSADNLFRALVVQRSRAYVKESQIQQGANTTLFPERQSPKVVEYSVKKTYGRLLEKVEDAFAKTAPLFILGIYYPLAYYKGDNKLIDPLEQNRQRQVVGLIRTQFLKRFESSSVAFDLSCDRLLQKLLTWVTRHSETAEEKRRLDNWQRRHEQLIGHIRKQQLEFWGEEPEEDQDEDIVTDEMLQAVDYLPRDDYRVEDILSDCFQDMDQILIFIEELRKFEPRHDDKLKALLKLLSTDRVLKAQKVLIFSEFAETARYLKKQLVEQGIKGVEQIDSATKKRGDVIHRFSPYYNGFSSDDIKQMKQAEIRVLISTDVLSEGLNLQDATRLINYDLHWNPVRLMQRIGRVDRRMNREIEEKIIADHPEQKDLRGKVEYFNFLPPEDLEILLRLYTKVSHKTLRISKTFGIEGKRLLRPDDDWDDLRQFNHDYEGDISSIEKMYLEYQKLLKSFPDLTGRLNSLPGRVFSGKQHPKSGSRAVFFCYAIPALSPIKRKAGEETSSEDWTEKDGTCQWYLCDLAGAKIMEEPAKIIEFIRSTPATPRQTAIGEKTLSEIRAQLDRHIKNTCLRQLQAPVGVKPVLKCWMELS